MILGILSDTHDNLPVIAKAVSFFNRRKAEFVLHAGDFVAPFTVGLLMKLECEWLGVFGNNDGEKEGLALKSGGRIGNPPLRKKIGGRSIVVVHDLATLTLKGPKPDLVVFGHNHTPSVEQRGRTLFVNPGECSGWLSGVPTVALVDLDAMSARIVKLLKR
jgi:uncharacterized protein